MNPQCGLGTGYSERILDLWGVGKSQLYFFTKAFDPKSASSESDWLCEVDAP